MTTETGIIKTEPDHVWYTHPLVALCAPVLLMGLLYGSYLTCLATAGVL